MIKQPYDVGNEDPSLPRYPWISKPHQVAPMLHRKALRLEVPRPWGHWLMGGRPAYHRLLEGGPAVFPVVLKVLKCHCKGARVQVQVHKIRPRPAGCFLQCCKQRFWTLVTTRLNRTLELSALGHDCFGTLACQDAGMGRVKYHQHVGFGTMNVHQWPALCANLAAKPHWRVRLNLKTCYVVQVVSVAKLSLKLQFGVR